MLTIFQIETKRNLQGISTPDVIEKYLKYEIDEIHPRRTCECALSIPDRDPPFYPRWDDSNGWNRVARSPNGGGGGGGGRGGAPAIGQTRVLEKRKKKERRRRGRKEETVDSHREILDTLPSTRRLKLLRSARDDRCLVSSFTPLGSGNRSCLANVSSAETIFLAAALLLFFER